MAVAATATACIPQRAGSEVHKVVRALRIGDEEMVLLPLRALGGRILLDKVLAKDFAAELVGLEGLDRLEQRPREPGISAWSEAKSSSMGPGSMDFRMPSMPAASRKAPAR